MRWKQLLWGGFLFTILGISWPAYLHLSMNRYERDIEDEIATMTERYQIRVHYRYNRATYFPHHPSASGVQAWSKHVKSSLPVLRDFLSAYPDSVIKKNLSDIFLLGRLKFMGREYAGSYYGSTIYLAIGSLFRDSDTTLRGVLHAEFSSILFHRYEFPKKKWQETNRADWKYLGTGLDMLGRDDVHYVTPELLADGFLEQYSQASIEEDFNTMVKWMFTKPERLQSFCLRYERIRKKYQLTIDFYKLVDQNIKVPDFSCD
jgi:hypothetical protein